jgi:hypothetical protein
MKVQISEQVWVTVIGMGVTKQITGLPRSVHRSSELIPPINKPGEAECHPSTSQSLTVSLALPGQPCHTTFPGNLFSNAEYNSIFSFFQSTAFVPWVQVASALMLFLLLPSRHNTWSHCSPAELLGWPHLRGCAHCFWGLGGDLVQ